MKCIKCDAVLFPGDNWYRSDIRKSHHICTSCHSDMRMRNAWSKKVKRYKGPQTKGSVYLLHEIGNGFFKIGMSQNIQRRIRSLEGGNPHELEIIHTVESVRANWLEVELHDLFAHKNHRLEWFHFEPEDIPHVIAAMENGKEKQLDYILPRQTEFTVEEVFKRTVTNYRSMATMVG